MVQQGKHMVRRCTACQSVDGRKTKNGWGRGHSRALFPRCT
jgi:hypothetical protein